MNSKTRLKCPECGHPVVKNGMQTMNRKGDRKQVYLCKHCRRRTVNPVMVKVDASE